MLIVRKHLVQVVHQKRKKLESSPADRIYVRTVGDLGSPVQFVNSIVFYGVKIPIWFFLWKPNVAVRFIDIMVQLGNGDNWWQFTAQPVTRPSATWWGILWLKDCWKWTVDRELVQAEVLSVSLHSQLATGTIISSKGSGPSYPFFGAVSLIVEVDIASIIKALNEDNLDLSPSGDILDEARKLLADCCNYEWHWTRRNCS
ncbi:hypothetical protein ACH5RR_015747 [Cinchona calisaya]|uniref:Uncharacterized protein n=1 Tax=Cinchona calisaya TaxID=153742 RepID=A0ABD2ZUE2_9GENT